MCTQDADVRNRSILKRFDKTSGKITMSENGHGLSIVHPFVNNCGLLNGYRMPRHVLALQVINNPSRWFNSTDNLIMRGLRAASPLSL